MPRKFRPHQCPDCKHRVAEAYSEYFKGLCNPKNNMLYNIWLEGETKRNCKDFTVISKE